MSTRPSKHMKLVWFWFRNSLGGLAARVEGISEPPTLAAFAPTIGLHPPTAAIRRAALDRSNFMDLVSIPANPVPEDVVTGMLKTRDGVNIRFARWHPPPGRKGTVCLFQGRAEFIEKYFETVREL